MNISTKKQNGWSIVSISGRMVVREMKNVRKVFESLEKGPNPHIAIDFSKTVYIDSSSITLLINFQKRLWKARGTFVGYGANKDIMDIFDLVSLGEFIDLYKSRAEFEKVLLNPAK